MDIGACSTDLAQLSLHNQVSTAVLSKSLDQTKAQGEDFLKLVASAPQANPLQDPMMGTHVNLLA